MACAISAKTTEISFTVRMAMYTQPFKPQQHHVPLLGRLIKVKGKLLSIQELNFCYRENHVLPEEIELTKQLAHKSYSERTPVLLL